LETSDGQFIWESSAAIQYLLETFDKDGKFGGKPDAND
jgi:hypothetical protein